MRAIERRVAGGHVPDVDIVFIADWILNACDATRGVPRLVNLLNATDGDIECLARHYESYVSRKGRRRYRIRRESQAVRGFENRLSEMIQATKRHAGRHPCESRSQPVGSPPETPWERERGEDWG